MDLKSKIDVKVKVKDLSLGSHHFGILYSNNQLKLIGLNLHGQSEEK